jgi:hypothetical protein
MHRPQAQTIRGANEVQATATSLLAQRLTVDQAADSHSSSAPHDADNAPLHLENFLYFNRCGMTLSMPNRRFLSSS